MRKQGLGDLVAKALAAKAAAVKAAAAKAKYDRRVKTRLAVLAAKAKAFIAGEKYQAPVVEAPKETRVSLNASEEGAKTLFRAKGVLRTPRVYVSAMRGALQKVMNAKKAFLAAKEAAKQAAAAAKRAEKAILATASAVGRWLVKAMLGSI